MIPRAAAPTMLSRHQMAKRIHHMGMTLSKEDHDNWHRQAGELSPEKHTALMKRMGITPEEDAEWHRTHQTLHEQRAKDKKAVNPLAVGGAFVEWCVKQGWLAQEGRQYFATKEGARELKGRFEIRV